MSKVLELSKETYERLLALAQQRACTPEELLHTLLVDAEQSLGERRPDGRSRRVIHGE